MSSPPKTPKSYSHSPTEFLSKRKTGIIEFYPSTGRIRICPASEIDRPVKELTADTLCAECVTPVLSYTDTKVVCIDYCGHWFHIRCLEEVVKYNHPCKACKTPEQAIDMTLLVVFVTQIVTTE